MIILDVKHLIRLICEMIDISLILFHLSLLGSFVRWHFQLMQANWYPLELIFIIRLLSHLHLPNILVYSYAYMNLFWNRDHKLPSQKMNKGHSFILYLAGTWGRLFENLVSTYRVSFRILLNFSLYICVWHPTIV